MKKSFTLLSILFCCILVFHQTAFAQTARLGIQGILKKANGNAVDDGPYRLTFKLYTQPEGGTAIWDEIQEEVEVIGGIYTATLGVDSALNVPFDQTYYLGVTVGNSSEMLPRIQLTTAPYALALIGNTNQFPSSGVVRADSLRANGHIQARGGAPGANNANKNGFSFSGNGGDNDSGMFSTGNGEVSLYSNNIELLELSDGGSPTVRIRTNGLVDSSLTIQRQLIVNGPVSSNLNLATSKGIQYNGVADWRLVDTDIFASGNKQGWESTTALFNTTAGTTTLENFSNSFHGWALRPNNESDWLKKQFTIDQNVVGPYTQVKIKFKYFFLDSWDASGSEGTDLGLAGFSTDEQGTTLAFAWSQPSSVYGDGGSLAALNFYNGSGGYTDAATIGEMTMTRRDNGTTFWVFFGAKMVGTDDENYAIGDIEVWVR